eukprot:Nk52_evm10s257 gene=Nk52_evmTU10s257
MKLGQFKTVVGVVILIAVLKSLPTNALPRKAVGQGQRGSDLTMANISIYTSGESNSLPAYLMTKQALSQVALSIFSKLPTDKSKTNLTWIAQQVDYFNPATKKCNESAFADACVNLYSSSVMLSLYNDTLPFGWNALVTLLAYGGLDKITVFAQYGCVGSVGIARYGRDIVAVPKGMCPSMADPTYDSSAMQGRKSADSNVNCWRSPYSDMSKCIMETGLPETGLLMFVGGVTYARTKYKISVIKEDAKAEKEELEQLLNDRALSFNEQMNAISNKYSKVRQEYESLEYKSSDEALSIYSRPFDESIETLNKEVWKSSKYFAKVERGSRKLTKMVEDLKEENIRIAEQIEQAKYDLKFLKLTRVNNDDVRYRQPSAEYIQNENHETKFFSNFEPLVVSEEIYFDDDEKHQGDFCTGDEVYKENWAGDGNICDFNDPLSANAIVEEKLVMNEPSLDLSSATVAQMHSLYPSEIGNDEVSAPISDMTSSAFGDIVDSVGVAGLGVGAEFLNTFLMLGMAEDMLQSGAKAVIELAGRGFNQTISSIHSIAKASYEEYKDTVDTMAHLMDEMEADVECRNAWEDLQNNIYVVQGDYGILVDAFNQCNVRKNLTGEALVNCTYSFSSTLDKAMHSATYSRIGNLNAGIGWEQSLVGTYLYSCAKFQTIKGYPPDSLAKSVTQMYQIVKKSMFKAGSLMSWIALSKTTYMAANYKGEPYNYTYLIRDSQLIRRNQTADMTCWFRDAVVPPAIYGYMPPSLWTDYFLYPPAQTYFQINVLHKSNWTEKGYLTPLIWTPEVVAATEDRNTWQRDTPSQFLAAQSNSAMRPDTPPSIQQVKLSNVTNVTDSATRICSNLPCMYRTCHCSAFTTDECNNCRDNPEAGLPPLCDCSLIVEFEFQAHRPARGWAGVYRNNSGQGLIQDKLPLCTIGDVHESARCIPGLFMVSMKNNEIRLFANSTYQLNWVPESNYEKQKLASYDADPLVKGSVHDDDILFQMVDSTWAWKYGVAQYADYLNSYFSSVPYTLENIFTKYNTSALEDNWRFHWAIRYGDGASDFIAVHISDAATPPLSNSTFGFGCQQEHTFHQGAVMGGDVDCDLKEVHIEYPPHC